MTEKMIDSIEQNYDVQAIESDVRGVYLLYDERGKHLVLTPRKDMSNALLDNLMLKFTLNEAEHIGRELLEQAEILKQCLNR